MGSVWKNGLIQSRGAAVFALCFTGLLAVLSFRSAFFHPYFKSDWLNFGFLRPAWLGPALGLFFYFYVLWLGVVFYRAARGKEHILVAGMFVGILLSLPSQKLSASALVAVRYADAFGDAVAFLMAVEIFLEMRAANSTRQEKI